MSATAVELQMAIEHSRVSRGHGPTRTVMLSASRRISALIGAAVVCRSDQRLGTKLEHAVESLATMTMALIALEKGGWIAPKQRYPIEALIEKLHTMLISKLAELEAPGDDDHVARAASPSKPREPNQEDAAIADEQSGTAHAPTNGTGVPPPTLPS